MNLEIMIVFCVAFTSCIIIAGTAGAGAGDSDCLYWCKTLCKDSSEQTIENYHCCKEIYPEKYAPETCNDLGLKDVLPKNTTGDDTTTTKDYSIGTFVNNGSITFNEYYRCDDDGATTTSASAGGSGTPGADSITTSTTITPSTTTKSTARTVSTSSSVAPTGFPTPPSLRTPLPSPKVCPLTRFTKIDCEIFKKFFSVLTTCSTDLDCAKNTVNIKCCLDDCLKVQICKLPV